MSNLMVSPLRNFTANTTTAPASGQLGRCFEDDNGAVYKLVKFTGIVAAGDAVKSSAADSYSVVQSTAGSIPLGVAMAAAAADSYGFIQVGGLATVNAISTAAVSNVALVSTGKVGDQSVTVAADNSSLGRIAAAPVYSAATQITGAKVLLQGLK